MNTCSSSVPSLSRNPSAGSGPRASEARRDGSATSVPSVAKIENLSPLVLALALSLRVRRAFGECLESVTRIIAHLRAEITLRQKLSADIAAIDAAMEREAPELWACLQNDPAAARRRIWAAWKETHRLTLIRAQEADPRCPKHLLAD